MQISFWLHDARSGFGFRVIAPVLAVSLVFVLCVSGVSLVSGQAGDSGTKLQAADSAVNSAFAAVLEAERAGANITELLSRLNVAADLLGQAEIANRNGDFVTAGDKCYAVLPIAEEVAKAAVTARSRALDDSANAFWSSFAFSVVGAFVFVLALFLIWRQFKRLTLKRLLEGKPEVKTVEA